MPSRGQIGQRPVLIGDNEKLAETHFGHVDRPEACRDDGDFGGYGPSWFTHAAAVFDWERKATSEQGSPFEVREVLAGFRLIASDQLSDFVVAPGLYLNDKSPAAMRSEETLAVSSRRFPILPFLDDQEPGNPAISGTWVGVVYDQRADRVLSFDACGSKSQISA